MANKVGRPKKISMTVVAEKYIQQLEDKIKDLTQRLSKYEDVDEKPKDDDVNKYGLPYSEYRELDIAKGGGPCTQ